MCRNMPEIAILELFSGIGGMHYALEYSSVPGKIVLAIDVHETANMTYKHNFSDTKCTSSNVQGLKVERNQHIEGIFMSPPCQPFTRNGNFKDVEDMRCNAFLFICDMIKESQLKNLKYILMENVKGFEKSEMHEIFIEALTSAEFYYQEFIITPTEIGVANTRHRYYCIARQDKPFSFANGDDYLTKLPNFHSPVERPQISSYIDDLANHDNYLLPDNILEKRFQVLDICTSDSTNSMCFTKSYSRYVEGTGSVFCHLTKDELTLKLELIKLNDDDLELKKSLQLRFFTPLEVSRLMSFPPSFKFPDKVTEKQKYKLLGNSLNVAVVGELMKLLFDVNE
ncbi:CLUMA_CG009922, isoform A [Clunio marinus]|uniref:tRNA (cytosine(38)-C(5))-methyltransferase n=1 Tax=Clunio marinus TaxID=568069 RepID=A0A1J1IAR4_9DIPT|nr:CLUMA_CG009922, isoform A [Clunio marinus]